MHSPITDSRVAWVEPGPHAARHASLPTFGYVHFTPGVPGLPVRLESYYYSILEFLHATFIIPMQVLLLHSGCAPFITEKSPWNLWSGTCPSLLALHSCCCHRWSECHRSCAGHRLTCFSELSQLTLPHWFKATYVTICACALLIMLRWFWHVIIPMLLCSA